ncbi:MAG: site-specific integrase [Acidimicrobiales bacterium]
MARRTPATVTALRPTGERLGAAVGAFLTERDLAPSTRRVYGIILERLVTHLSPEVPLAQVNARTLTRFMNREYGHLAPASWNRTVATLGSFFA